jgi:4-amino-4-deoxy-L-arabinose transferase-like glycosyltransferase
MFGVPSQPGSVAELVETESPDMNNKVPLFPIDFLLIVVLAAILRLPYLSLAQFGDPDESWYILGAREVLHGHLPYTSYWEIKPLGSFVLMALSMAAFGPSVEVVRLLGMVCVIMTACLLHLLTRLIFPGNRIPLVAALLYLAFTVALPGTSTMTEILLAPFTAVGVLLLTRAAERDRSTGAATVSLFGVAGLAFGIAIWIKYVPAIPAALTGCIALLAVWQRFGGGITRALSASAMFFFALLLPTIASIGFYAWMGALNVFLDANFGFASRYVVSRTVFTSIHDTTIVVKDAWPLLLTAAAVFLPTGRRFLFAPGRAYLGTLMVAWFIGEILGLLIQGKLFQNHYLLLLPPLCILSAVAIGVYSNALARPSKTALVTSLAAAFVIIGPAVVHLRAVAADLSRPDVPRQIAKTIVSDAKPEDGLFVVNYEVIIYLLAKMPLPSRYAEPYLLVGPAEALVPDDSHAEVHRILGAKPRYIVLNQSWRDSSLSWWDPEMMAFVEATLAQDYTKRKSWVLPTGGGTVALFVRSE